MAFSSLEYLFSLEIFTFLYYANEESDDIIYVGGSTKTVKHPILSLEIFKQCSSNFAPAMYITKETVGHLLCSCHDNSYTADFVLIKTKFPRFYLKHGSSTPTN